MATVTLYTVTAGVVSYTMLTADASAISIGAIALRANVLIVVEVADNTNAAESELLRVVSVD